MSRTYRHSNRDTKIIKGEVASFLSINFYKKNPKRLKNGIIDYKIDSNESIRYLWGLYQWNHIPTKFKKNLRRKIRAQMKNELINAFNKNDYDKVGEILYIKNAAYEYF